MHMWINCKQYSELVSARLDRPLSVGSRLALKLHGWLCPPCQRVARQFYFLREACRYVPPEETGQAQAILPEDARERIKCAMNECIRSEAQND